MKKIWNKIKSRIPVSRGRYERELSLIRLSVNRTIAEEKAQLESMVRGISYVSTYPQNRSREVRASMRVTDDLVYFCRSPYHRTRLFYEIAEQICKSLEKELR